MPAKTGPAYEFGPFCLDPAERLLLHCGRAVPLPPKAFDILLFLVERSGHLVEKHELLTHVWPDATVEEANVAQNIWEIRRALEESRAEHRYIETIPKHGYRFVAPVHVSERSLDHAAVTTRGPQANRSVAGPRSLRRVLVASLVAFLGAGLLSVWWVAHDRRRSPAAAPRRSLAVLPFRMLDNVDGDEYLSVGLADALITRLGNLERVTIRPMSATLKYGGSRQDPLTAARDLRVSAFVDGTVQRSQDRLRVTVRLVNTSDGIALWAQAFDEPLRDLLSLEDSIGDRIAFVLIPKLTDKEQSTLTRRHGPRDAEAYRDYLIGRYYWNKRTLAAFEKAQQFFTRAIERDPAYAEAYAGLADTYLLRATFSGRPFAEVAPMAEPAVLKALQLDDTVAGAHARLAWLLWHRYEWRAAEEEFRRAVDLTPGDPTSHQWFALFLKDLGRTQEAIGEMRRAQDLDPLSVVIAADVGHILFFARRYDEAIVEGRKAVEMEPAFAYAHFALAFPYEKKGLFDLAIAELKTAMDPARANPAIIATLARSYWLSGRTPEAKRLLQQLQELLATGDAQPSALALAYVPVDRHEAVSLLIKGCGGRADCLVPVTHDPRFDEIRSEPEFARVAIHR
jgi:DNA-binding winged helix-turn-helix (wHTH) protein/TolB-like protein/Flp pilus assembly protein TadD